MKSLRTALIFFAFVATTTVSADGLLEDSPILKIIKSINLEELARKILDTIVRFLQDLPLLKPPANRMGSISQRMFIGDDIPDKIRTRGNFWSTDDAGPVQNRMLPAVGNGIGYRAFNGDMFINSQDE